MNSKHDYDYYLMLKEVLKSGKFEIKGDAVAMTASLFKWYDEQEAKYKPKGGK